MEPVSIAASLVTIIKAGRAGLHGVRRLCESRGAPEDLRLFRAELESLQQLLENIRTFSLQRPSDTFGVLLDGPLKQAEKSINSVNQVLSSTAFGISRVSPVTQAQLTWLRYRDKILALSEDIRNAKMDLGLYLGCFTA